MSLSHERSRYDSSGDGPSWQHYISQPQVGYRRNRCIVDCNHDDKIGVEGVSLGQAVQLLGAGQTSAKPDINLVDLVGLEPTTF
jgi:hypothetical protein